MSPRNRLQIVLGECLTNVHMVSKESTGEANLIIKLLLRSINANHIVLVSGRYLDCLPFKQASDIRGSNLVIRHDAYLD